MLRAGGAGGPRLLDGLDRIAELSRPWLVQDTASGDGRRRVSLGP